MNLNSVRNVKLLPNAGRAGAFARVLLVGGLGIYGAMNGLSDADGGHRDMNFNPPVGTNDKVYPEGTHFMIPWFDRAVTLNARARPNVVESTSGSNDSRTVRITLRVATRPVADMLRTIRTLGENYYERFLPSIVQETLTAVTAQHDASQLIKQREAASREIRRFVHDGAENFNIALNNVSTTNLTFGKEFTPATEVKQVAALQVEVGDGDKASHSVGTSQDQNREAKQVAAQEVEVGDGDKAFHSEGTSQDQSREATQVAAQEAEGGDGDGDKASHSEGTSEGQNGEEEEEECGFCLFMKGGPCGKRFSLWQDCVENAEKSEKDIVDECAQLTSLLKLCMEMNPQYYGPILDAEKAMEAEVNSAETSSTGGNGTSGEVPVEGRGEGQTAVDPVVEAEVSSAETSSAGGSGTSWEVLDETAVNLGVVEATEVVSVVVDDKGEVQEVIDEVRMKIPSKEAAE